MKEFDFYQPSGLEAALELLACYKGDAAVISGGTDLIISLEGGLTPKCVIDINGLDELRYIRETDNCFRIGSGETHSSLGGSKVVQKHAYALSMACSDVGSWQIRNRGTIGGNLATASPAGDTYPPLMVLEARLKLRSQKGERIVPIEDFCTGPKQTCLRPDEILTEIEIPKKPGTESSWMKMGKREKNALSIVSVSVAVKISDGKFGFAKVALGSVGPTPFIAEESSLFLSGKVPSDENIRTAAKIAATEARPSDQVLHSARSSPRYRRAMTEVMTKRALVQAVDRARSLGGGD